jgi:AraC-like DNA-binding protein
MKGLRSEDTPRPRHVRRVRHQSSLGWWELAFSAPHPALAPHVRRYCGWLEHTTTPLRRLEPPTSDIPIIFLFGSRVLAYEPRTPDHPTAYGSFVTGLYDTCAVVGSEGPMAGVQVDVSPLGARLLLDRPLAELANRMVALEDVWGADADALVDALANAPDWETRFALIDRALLARLDRATPVHSVLAWTMRTLLATHGRAPIRELVRTSGWSARHLGARVQHEFGLTPKTIARVLRLGQAVERLRCPGPVRLAEVAADCRYYDQAHFNRDFRAFTGLTPSQFLAGRLPDSGGFTIGE